MWIQYRADVHEPAFLRGLKGEIKELEPQWAFQLITDGYALPVDAPALPAVKQEDASSVVDESGDSGTGGEEAAG